MRVIAMVVAVLVALLLVEHLVAAELQNKNLPRVAICLITRDERNDLEEWLSYHHALGVSNVILFENNSEESALVDPEIMKWASSGFVMSYEYFQQDQEPNNQIWAYRRCLNDFGHLFDFMGFVDTDEFIVIRGEHSLPEMLDKYRAYGGLALNSMFLGSSGHENRPNGGILTNYHKCVKSNLVKSFVVTKNTVDAGPTPHAFQYKPGYFAVDVANNPVDSAWNPRGNGLSVYGSEVGDYLFKYIYVHHYVLKSLADFKRKVHRGSGDGGGHGMHFFKEIDSLTVNNCSYVTHKGGGNISYEWIFDSKSGGWVEPVRDSVHHQVISTKPAGNIRGSVRTERRKR